MGRDTQGTETSKYLKEKKVKTIPQVAASERGLAQTNDFGCWGCGQSTCIMNVRGIMLESWIEEGENPVLENWNELDLIQSTTGHEKSCGKQGGPSSKAKYYLVTDSA